MKHFVLGTSLILLSHSALATPGIVADSWQKLWLNSDQQAERLLEKGDAKAAANTFINPRHKAYAQLQAGDYANAAQGFGKYKDSDAFYNQGNAYAHLNQLPQALQAYEAALKLAPDNRDALKNRDLVKQALKKQQQANQQKNSQNSQGKGQNESDQNKQNQNAQNNQQNSADKAKDSKQAEAKPSETKPGTSKESDSKQAQSEKPKENAKDSQSLKQTQMHQPEQDTQAQVEKDAQAGVQSQQKSASEQQLPKETNLSKASGNEMPATNEQQIAQDQWLKQIPDDPSGLLRRQLLIEHLMRQQGLVQ